MPRRNRLTISNFGLGMIRDAALEQDGAYSLYTLENADIVYDGVFAYLRKRQGSDAYNATAFAAETKQIHHFIDSSQNEHLLVVANNKLYRLAIDGTGAPVEIKLNGTTSHAMTTPPYPFVNAGDRCFFSDSAATADWYWVDDTSLAANTSYQVGIDKPAFEPSFVSLENVGHLTSASQYLLGPYQYNSQGFQLSYDQFADAVTVFTRYAPTGGDLRGNLRLHVTTNTGGNPTFDGTDFTYPHENMVSPWYKIQDFELQAAAVAGDGFSFVLEDGGVLAKSTQYHFVIELDADYIATYNAAGPRGVWIDYDGAAGYANGTFKWWDGAAWIDSGWDLKFGVGGGVTDTDNTVYDGHTGQERQQNYYKVTYYSTLHQSESFPTEGDPHATQRIGAQHFYSRILGLSASSDAQSDKIRLYKSDAIDGTYYWIGEFDDDEASVIDGTNSDNLGSVLQSEDHYRLANKNDTEVPPIRLEFWKQRLWATVAGEDTVRFSKVLAEDGPLGVTGDPILDAFPADNFIDAKTSGYVQALKRMGNDMLAVYYDDSVGVIYGADEATNPPTDLQFRMMLYDDGLIAPRAVVDFRGMHVYLSRHGVFTFNGTAQTESITSGFLQSILDGISDTNLALSIMGERDGELWLLVDADADGELETFLLFDTKQKRPSWRQYEYNFNANDFVILDSGNYKNRVIVATDLSDFKLRRLHSGNADTSVAGADVAVEATLETHPMRSMAATQGRALRERSRYIGAGILPYFPTATVPTFTTTITDRAGSTTTLTNDFAPSSNTDKRAFHVGLPRIASEEARLKIAWSSVNRDEIREVSFDWLEL